ncbi:MAG: CaiB/BaiF CoA-transferase family protein [Pseudomonadota bacterium]
MAPEGWPAGALDGVLVIDLSRLLPGPCCSMILADHGARVIRVEQVSQKATPLTAIPLSGLTRNKESIRLDLKHPEGRAVFYRLVERADVVLEGFRTGVTERLGVDEATLRVRNPGLVYCSITGYGAEGPRRDDVGHDLNFLAATGLLELLAPPGESPSVPALQLADVAGAIHAAFGIVAALRHRDRTGEGQRVDVALADAALSLAIAPLAFREVGLPYRAGESALSGGLACYGVYAARDGRRLAVGALEPHFFRAFLGVLGLDGMAAGQFVPGRQAALREAIAMRLAEADRVDWLAAFDAVEACVSPVETLADAVEAPTFRARGQVVEGHGGDLVLGPTVRLDRSPGTIRSAPASPGAQTHSLLAELGFDTEAVVRLVEQVAAE